MQKTLKDFTPEIQSKIPEYQKRTLEGIHDGARYHSFDLEKAKKAINWNYQKCGFKNPVVLVAENPLEQQYLFNYLVENKDKYAEILKLLYVLQQGNLKFDLAVDDKNCNIELPSWASLLGNLTSVSVSDKQLYSQLRSQLVSQLDSQLYSQLRSQLDSQLDSQLGSQLYSQLLSQLGSQLDSQLKTNNLSSLKYLFKLNSTYLFTLNVYSDVIYTWYEFIRKEFNLECTVNEDFQTAFTLQKESGIYSCIFSEMVAVVCKYPVKINQETSGQCRLNSVTENAVVWSYTAVPFDCYYVNGANISKDLFEKLSRQEYTFEDWSKEQNEEIRSAVLGFYEQKFGNEFVYRFLSKNLKEIDTYVDKKDEKYLEKTTKSMNIGVYTLFKGVINDTEIAYVRCYCPSTDRMFFLGVEPSNTNAKDAIASLCQVPVDLVDHLETITRCGEIFALTFNKEGKEKLLRGAVDIHNVVSLQGDEYFSKIEWEY